MRLYTFAISHFSEKARWALVLEGLPFEERPLVPGLHALVTRRLGNATSVPVLVDGAAAVQGSSAILDHLEKRGSGCLVPTDGFRAEAARIEAAADRAFGRGIQTIFYATLLKHRGLVTDLWSQKNERLGKLFYAASFPIMRALVTKAYRTSGDGVAKATDRFRQTFDELETSLESKPYFGGDALSRADITVASLLAPLCRPPEHPVKWPLPVAELETFSKEFEGRPLWNYVLRMYAEHRRPSAS